MRLRHQLLLVSLLVLCLPWAGCQFVRETESVMLQGQERALLATAKAVSLRLAEDESLSLPVSSVTKDNSPIYFHALRERPAIDGFDDDWRFYPILPGSLLARTPELEIASDTNSADADPLNALVYAGIYRDLNYLFLRIPDRSFDILDPSLDPLRSGDYLRLIRDNQPDLYLGASAPGEVHARYLETRQVRSEYGLSGVWNHTGEAYQIELRMNPRLLGDKLAIEFVDLSSAEQHPTYQIGVTPSGPAPFVDADADLAAALAVFASDDLRLAIVDSQGWLKASVGGLQIQGGNSPQPHGVLTGLYQLILKDDDIPPLADWRAEGRFDSEDIPRVLAGNESVARFRVGDRKVSRGSIPIYRGDQQVGAVVVEQTADSLATSTNRAFNRLMFWSLVSMLFVGAGLIFYASLLSYRIRKLSKAAEMAIDDNGQILRDFPVSSFDDEVGDLSRSFDQLLGRLHEYTDYLRTLSGKLSHELKTPLAIVKSSLENLEQQNLDDDARVYTDRARDGAARLSAIFQALSSATRLEESIQSADMELIELVELLRAVHRAYISAYPNARILLVVPDSGQHVNVRVAPELIVQMLDKLVDNAVDFCTETGEIELSLERDALNSEHCLIRVSNDGPLLPGEMQRQLFDSLVSVRSTSSDEPHLGLGMYIARLIAEFHNGQILAENRPDKTGVVVSVQLPIVEATA